MTTSTTGGKSFKNGRKKEPPTTLSGYSAIMLLGITVAFALSFWHKGSILAFVIPSGSQVGVVNTGYARYQGNRTLPNTVAYLGIPYAEPPVGNLRFRAPLPLNTTRLVLESAGKTIDATQYPEFCIQGTTGGGDAGGAGSEDCLKVNIYAPPDATKGSKCEEFYGRVSVVMLIILQCLFCSIFTEEVGIS